MAKLSKFPDTLTITPPQVYVDNAGLMSAINDENANPLIAIPIIAWKPNAANTIQYNE